MLHFAYIGYAKFLGISVGVQEKPQGFGVPGACGWAADGLSVVDDLHILAILDVDFPLALADYPIELPAVFTEFRAGLAESTVGGLEDLF